MILRTSPYSVRMWENAGKMRSRTTPNTDTFYAVLTINRITHGCSFNVPKNLFGVSRSLATECFNTVIKVKTPKIEEECVNEYKSFTENYTFPCGRTLNGFHVSFQFNRLKIISFLKTNILSQAWG